MRAKIRNALISVYDKEGIITLARGLSRLGVQILSTGGTARYLIDHRIPVTRVADYTRFPEILEGRVKTLHPKIHAGILASRHKKKHLLDIKKLGIQTIDMVIANLYPFEQTASIKGIGLDEVLEMIDIGGPSMVRAAAKNFRYVTILVDPRDYPLALSELKERGNIPQKMRFELAIKAFQHTADYDMSITSFFSRIQRPSKRKKEGAAISLPDKFQCPYLKMQDLRYGENPHQKAALYKEMFEHATSVCTASQIQGKELSFNNIIDFDAALSLVTEIKRPACVIIKHTNPCGVAIGKNPSSAYTKALETDPVSAFGSVIAFNREVDKAASQMLAALFVEGIIAPSFSKEALKILSAKKNLRLLQVGNLKRYEKVGFDLKKINGGLLLQEWDDLVDDIKKAKVVTKRKPTSEELKTLDFAWKVVKHVKSNAIVFAKKNQIVSIGAGQMSRVDSVKLCIGKAFLPTKGACMASDAFFPFRDGIDEAAKAGVTAVIQPGGSIRDKEAIKAANEHRMAMLFTGIRHFKH